MVLAIYNSSYHIVLSHGCIAKLWLTSFQGFYSYLTLVEPKVRAAAKISAGGCEGAPREF